MGLVLIGLEPMSDDRYNGFVGGDDLLGFESRSLEVTSDRQRGVGLLLIAWHGRRPVEMTVLGRALKRCGISRDGSPE